MLTKTIKFSNFLFLVLFCSNSMAATLEERIASLENEVKLLEQKPTIADLIRKAESPEPGVCPNGGFRHSLYADLDKSGTITPADKLVFKFHVCKKGYYLDGAVNSKAGYFASSGVNCGDFEFCFDVSAIFGPNKRMGLGKSDGQPAGSGVHSRVFFTKDGCQGTPFVKEQDIFYPGFEEGGKIQFFSAATARAQEVKVLSVYDYAPGKSKTAACRSASEVEKKFSTHYAASFDGPLVDPNSKIKLDEGGVLWF